MLCRMETGSPLTVGNGEFAFTADITGLQTLYEDYQELPLCTMSQWGWHTKPAPTESGRYTLDDLVMTEYEGVNGTKRYPVKRFEGNEEIYDWLRQNPHRLNLGRIALAYEDGEISKDEIDQVRQELHLYEGRLESRFCLRGEACQVETCCDSEEDMVAVRISSALLEKAPERKRLAAVISFPYGNSDITASDWTKPECHTTRVLKQTSNELWLLRKLDEDEYQVCLHWDGAAKPEINGHTVKLCFSGEEAAFCVKFCREKAKQSTAGCVNESFDKSSRYWKTFWETGGIADFSHCTDPRAPELERRLILSQYLLAVNSMGSMPPQETGLTCNSWYGKMHLEMYFWHCAWAPLWGHSELLERSLDWFAEHLQEARDNAARNGYKGARWPKMVAGDALDSPSSIAPLLVWQQPHVILMLELLRRQGKDRAFMERYWCLTEETAEFMADFAVYNTESGYYELTSPVIPVQECHKPMETNNPAFELEYWRYGLRTAISWAKELGRDYPALWEQVAEHMAPLPEKDGLYLAHSCCPETFTKYNLDHPSMLMAYGVLDGEADRKTMEATLRKVVEVWQYERLWGWDFAVMAMTATRLGLPKLALELLLKETAKNEYVESGNNRQRTRNDLPLYLPGNGSLLLAASMMLAGFEGSEELPGFPKDGTWDVRYENISPYV